MRGSCLLPPKPFETAALGSCCVRCCWRLNWPEPCSQDAPAAVGFGEGSQEGDREGESPQSLRWHPAHRALGDGCAAPPPCTGQPSRRCPQPAPGLDLLRAFHQLWPSRAHDAAAAPSPVAGEGLLPQGLPVSGELPLQKHTSARGETSACRLQIQKRELQLE